MSALIRIALATIGFAIAGSMLGPLLAWQLTTYEPDRPDMPVTIPVGAAGMHTPQIAYGPDPMRRP